MNRDAGACRATCRLRRRTSVGQRQVLVDEGAQDGEEQRHEQRRGAGLAGHVAERHEHRAVGLRQDVVEVAAHGVGGLGQAEGLDAGPRPGAVGQHRLLDLARHFEVALEREAVGHFEQHEQVHQQEPAEQPERAIGEERGGHADVHEEERDRHRHAHQPEAAEQLQQADHGGGQRHAVHQPARR